MNNVLVIIDGQDEKKVFSFPSGLTEQECFDKIKHSMELGVKRKFFFKNSEVSPKTYEEYYHLVDNDLVLNERFFLETEITKKNKKPKRHAYTTFGCSVHDVFGNRKRCF